MAKSTELFCDCGNYIAITKFINGRYVNMCATCYQKWLVEENKLTGAYLKEQLQIIGEMWFDTERCGKSDRFLRAKAANWLGVPMLEKLYQMKTKSEVERALRPYKDGTIVPTNDGR